MIADLIDNEDIITQPDEIILNSNPFPGIRPFEFNESHLFFGQDAVCDQILAKLKQNRFVCIMGNAGVGKTSLINCGIKPALLGGFLFNNNVNWEIYHFRPGLNPYQNLTKCLINNNLSDSGESPEIPGQIYYNILKRGKQGLVELLNHFPDNRKQYCFIIDQFEDLFTLDHKINDYQQYEEIVHFIDLFLEALNQFNNFHFVISIRSDFTNNCVMFPALAEFINSSNVLVPKMDRNQLKEVILGPLRIFHTKIEEHLLVQILNDTTFYEDELPRLQYTLRQMFRSWKLQGNRNKSIGIKEYENSGGIGHSVSNNANAIFDAFSDNDKLICEKIFKALTQRISENNGVIRPESFNDLGLIINANIENIKRVVDFFTTDEVQILTIKPQNLKPIDYIELTHVSVIQSWNKLKGWVEDEAISSQMYKQLAETSSAYQVGKAGLLHPPDLNFALNWKEKQLPSLYWAKRYNPAFERTMVYLDASLKSFQAEEELKRNQEKKAQRKVRSFYIFFGVTVFIAVVFTVFSQFSRRSAEKQKQLALEQKNVAEIKSQKAEIVSKEAIIGKEKAEDAANQSERLRQLALEQSRFLAEQKELAELTAVNAVKKTAETEQNLQQVSKQRAELEKDAKIASAEKNAAEKEKEETFRKRMITTAQALAVKSNQTSGNRQLKALLAVQAYKFNNRYDGYAIHPDIFSALINSSADLGIQLRNSLRGHAGTVNTICIASRVNILYSTGIDGKVFAWNINDPAPAPRLVTGMKTRNLSMALSPNNRLLAVGTDVGIIKVIETSNPENSFELKGHNGPIFSLVFSRDGQQLFSSSSDKKVLLWDLDARNNTVVYNEQSAVRVLTASPDGRFLAGGAEDGRLLLWDIKSNQMTVINSDEQSPIYSIAFNNYGTMVASGDLKGNVRLWNPFSKKLIRNLKNHNARVVDIKFSASGDLMASASYDGTVYIFDTKFVNNPPNVIREAATYIMSVAFSNDNQRVIMGTNKNEFLVSWPCQSQFLSNGLCAKLSRDLSTEEWNTYIGSDVKYEKQCE
jgi:WD40 repeat protein